MNAHSIYAAVARRSAVGDAIIDAYLTLIFIDASQKQTLETVIIHPHIKRQHKTRLPSNTHHRIFLVPQRSASHVDQKAMCDVDADASQTNHTKPQPPNHLKRHFMPRVGARVSQRLTHTVADRGIFRVFHCVSDRLRELSVARRREFAAATAATAHEAMSSAAHARDAADAADADPPTSSSTHTRVVHRVFKFPASDDDEIVRDAYREPPGVARKLKGFAFFESMGSPKYHVAPMVDQSELAFRELCRRHGATLGYTPMIHARLFMESAKYRREIFSTTAGDRPLLAQFCANDPDVLIEAAKMIAPYCDGVDINFGCPQRIAKRGNYGAYLMDDWPTVEALIKRLDEELPVPVTAKIRVFDDLETTLKYAKMVEAAGAQLVAVHGRTREQKRCSEYRANWAFIKRIKEELKVPVLANGDVRSFAEAQACLEATGADGILSAEPLLSNPALFSDPPYYPPPTDGFAPIPLDGTAGVDLLIEYIEICRDYPAPFSSVRGHIWKLVGHWLAELVEFRDELNSSNGSSVSMESILDWAKRLRAAVKNIETSNEGRRRPIPKKTERALAREAAEEAKRAAIAESQREEDALKEIEANSSGIDTNKRQKIDTPQPATA